MNDNLEFPFTLLEVSNGRRCYLAAVEFKEEKKQLYNLPPSLLPLDTPPVLNSLVPDQIEAKIYEKLNNEENLVSSSSVKRVWTRLTDISSLNSIDLCPLRTSIQVERNETNGRLLGFYEAEAKEEGVAEKKLLYDDGFLMGSGSMETIVKPDEINSDLFETNFLTCPPGFDDGMHFEAKKSGKSSSAFNLGSVLFNKEFTEQFGSQPQTDEVLVEENEVEALPTLEEELPAVNKAAAKPDEKETAKNQKKPSDSPVEESWAEEIDMKTSVSNFHKAVPSMAHKYPFELDVFQKHAVLKLEDHQSVFVAAHTSAGKTVVAEYAIALTAKHMTRVIYTSPIKALSNQKFRDFKQTFSDVGLITGDVQINPEAFCLIMTTEILRSMLYNGSDVIRDLEWVIFDEVHYINDAERGVVWEEVLIMLPEHCNIILLSATVPNAFEFANWIGRTKQKKIYVISTPKRPVPLEHFLYTGNSNKTSDQMFMIVDGNRKFLTSGHKQAVDAKNQRTSKYNKSFGAKFRSGGGPSADKGVWLSLITRLRKLDQLPVVAFTFSRRRCDENAASLESLDLTLSSEKREIKVFFRKCVQRLSGSDRALPQVLQMSSLLERGVGVHHSGVLPILKEVIEMLFTRGMVKLLFATETFAMGVNMPARTVVFDSLRKHDGTQMRNLLPGEYIQMAGRAGRRGLDSTGNVILLCKGDIPDISELHTMMLGRVTKLHSQFRLTYGMILNLLRVEQLRVEEVMRKSFSEFHSRKDSKTQEEELRRLNEELARRSDVEALLRFTDYEQYFLCCQELMELRHRILEQTLTNAATLKVMNPGRVVVLAGKYQHHVAITLKTNTAKSTVAFSVLALLDKSSSDSVDAGAIWHPASILRRKLYRPESVTQELVEVTLNEISHITNKTLRVQADTIIADCKRRQVPRFRSDSPDQATSIACQQLLRLVDSNPEGLSSVDVISEMGVNQVQMFEDVTRMKSLESSIDSCFQCVERPSFKSQILEVESYLKLKEEYNKIKFLLSDESLFLLPEYQQRVMVLQKLRYVDDNSAVQMKGRVACEISTHELILTELVFENVLSHLEPTEIVALLSCCVFQQKIDMEAVSLTARLKEGMNRIIEVATMIGQTQYDVEIRQSVDDFVSVLKFGLVEVVYEWAKGTSFKDITNLTDVQEGMIVRTIQRLNELCRDVRNAARVIGDPVLYSKMEKCSELIKRDIVFAASLYIH
ncbi:unnamed protein product [Clavelina lepadiformis]|uniref:Helicase SKI2W n=1 Tax=Clavelina lepadiformis TaxID=159417 RepID=A0ABP0F3S0_CLALP